MIEFEIRSRSSSTSQCQGSRIALYEFNVVRQDTFVSEAVPHKLVEACLQYHGLFGPSPSDVTPRRATGGLAAGDWLGRRRVLSRRRKGSVFAGSPSDRSWGPESARPASLTTCLAELQRAGGRPKAVRKVDDRHVASIAPSRVTFP